MGLMGCLGCEGVYAVGAAVCPRCGTVSPRFEGVEDAVPKVTVGGASNGGASDAREEAPVTQSPPEPEPAAQETPVEAAAPEESGAPPPQDAEQLTAADVAAGYTDLSFAQLRAEAKARGLPAGGSAVELAARLAEHDAASGAGPVPDEPVRPDGAGGE